MGGNKHEIARLNVLSSLPFDFHLVFSREIDAPRDFLYFLSFFFFFSSFFLATLYLHFDRKSQQTEEEGREKKKRRRSFAPLSRIAIIFNKPRNHREWNRQKGERERERVKEKRGKKGVRLRDGKLQQGKKREREHPPVFPTCFMEDHRHDKKLAAPDRFPMAKRRDQDVEHLARAKMCSRTNHLGSRTDEGERLGGSRIVASFESCPLEKNYFSFLFFLLQIKLKYWEFFRLGDQLRL